MSTWLSGGRPEGIRGRAITIATTLLFLWGGSTLTPTKANEPVFELQTFWTAPGEIRALEQIVNHAAEADISFDIIKFQSYNELRTSVVERIALGYPSEISQWISGEDPSTLADSGYLHALPDVLNGKRLDTIVLPEVLREISYEGRPLTLPVGVHLQSIAVFNMTLLERAGLAEPPVTWEEYFDMADKLDTLGIAPAAISDEFWILREILHGILIGIDKKQALLDIYGEFDEQGKLLGNLERALDIMFRLRRYSDKSMQAQGFQALKWTDAVGLLTDNKTASVFMGDYVRSELLYNAPDRIDNFRCANQPGNESAYFVVDIFILFENESGQWRQAVDELVGVVLNKETQADYLFYKGGLPVVAGVEPNSLNACSATSLEIWNNAAEGRFVNPAGRDNENVAIMASVLPRLWADRTLNANSAAKILYDTLAPERP